MKKKINKKKIKKVSLISLSVILVLSIIAGIVAFIANMPDTRTPVFSEAAEKPEKRAFDEGEYKPGKYDLIVSVNGDDSNDGTIEKPLKTLKGAKEKLKAMSVEKTESITVWFREGTYTFYDTVTFDENDRGNVLYRSYPGEDVNFSGSKEIGGNWKTTKINGADAFVTDMPVKSDDDYFRSLFKDGKRLSRPTYPKADVLKVAAEPNSDEKFDSEWDPNFFVHSPVFLCAPRGFA